jgi:hypothetical protein
MHMDHKPTLATSKAAWALTVGLARLRDVKIEVEIEYDPPSEHSDRRARLRYDPKTDQEKFEWWARAQLSGWRLDPRWRQQRPLGNG